MTEAMKSHDEKPRMDLIPSEVLFYMGFGFGYGADKYEDRDWEQGADWGKYYAALLRHLCAWWAGEELDPESGLPHLAHAACCLAILAAYRQRGIGTDDRKLAA